MIPGSGHATTLRFSRKGDYMASGRVDGKVVIWYAGEEGQRAPTLTIGKGHGDDGRCDEIAWPFQADTKSEVHPSPVRRARPRAFATNWVYMVPGQWDQLLLPSLTCRRSIMLLDNNHSLTFHFQLVEMWTVSAHGVPRLASDFMGSSDSGTNPDCQIRSAGVYS